MENANSSKVYKLLNKTIDSSYLHFKKYKDSFHKSLQGAKSFLAKLKSIEEICNKLPIVFKPTAISSVCVFNYYKQNTDSNLIRFPKNTNLKVLKRLLQIIRNSMNVQKSYALQQFAGPVKEPVKHNVISKQPPQTKEKDVT